VRFVRIFRLSNVKRILERLFSCGIVFFHWNSFTHSDDVCTILCFVSMCKLVLLHAHQPVKKVLFLNLLYFASPLCTILRVLSNAYKMLFSFNVLKRMLMCRMSGRCRRSTRYLDRWVCFFLLQCVLTGDGLHQPLLSKSGPCTENVKTTGRNSCTSRYCVLSEPFTVALHECCWRLV